MPRDGRVLLVGNHSIYGFFDVPLVLTELHARRGLLVRGLADAAHFRLPAWRTVFERCCAVEATRANCRELMRSGQPVLVYPGGAREAHKRKGERYELLWQGRTGFAELAIEHDYPVVPLATIGGNDLYEIVLDRDAWPLRPLRSALTRAGARPELVPPLGRGGGWTPLPRAERLDFSFGEPLLPSAFTGARRAEDLKAATEEALRHEIERLRAERRGPDDELATTQRTVQAAGEPAGTGP